MSVATARASALVADADPWRGCPLDDGGPPYKEWQHFVVFGGAWTLVFNLNVDGVGMGRVIRIFDHRGWHGHVEPCREPAIRRGRIDATFGDSGMRWVGDRYEIWHRDPHVDFEIELQPRAIPSLTHDIRLGAGASLSWCMVPRLSASGRLVHDGTPIVFDRCAAYHDHNWGRFAWGGDLSWDWGCGVPDDPEAPWTIVFARMNDRARRRTTATSVFLVEDGHHVRYFRNAEVVLTSDGDAAARPHGRVPAAAALLLPERDRDVPLRTRFVAARDGDRLDGTVESETRGQVLVPSETDPLGVVRLNEATARVHVVGSYGATRFEMSGPGLLEVVRG